jgi:hypothetical protein
LVFDQAAVPAIERGRRAPISFTDVNVPRTKRPQSRYPDEIYGGWRKAASGLARDVPYQQPREGGYLLRPDQAESTSVVVKSWNSGEPVIGSNSSHAEMFMFPWLTHAMASGGLKEVHIQINLSPCSACASEFPDLKKSPGLIGTLTYVQAYECRDRKNPTILLDGTTTRADIALLRNREWEVIGPEPKWNDAAHVGEERAAAVRIIARQF